DTALADLTRDLRAFLPELIVCGTIVVLLLLRLLSAFRLTHLGGLTIVATVASALVSYAQWRGFTGPLAGERNDYSIPLFTGLLAYDYFPIFLRMFLLGFAALVVVMTMLTGIPDREDSGDFYVLLLGGTLGMMLMASANHLLMAYIAVEMASLPSYAL